MGSIYSLVCCTGWSSASDILHAYDIQAYLSNPLEQLQQISIKGEMLMSTRVASSLSIHMRRKFPMLCCKPSTPNYLLGKCNWRKRENEIKSVYSTKSLLATADKADTVLIQKDQRSDKKHNNDSLDMWETKIGTTMDHITGDHFFWTLNTEWMFRSIKENPIISFMALKSSFHSSYEFIKNQHTPDTQWIPKLNRNSISLLFF